MESEYYETAGLNENFATFVNETYPEGQRKIQKYIKGATTARQETTKRLNEMSATLKAIANHLGIEVPVAKVVNLNAHRQEG